MMPEEMSLPAPGGWVERLATVTCTLAIASVPVFSRSEGLSVIPQVFALFAALAAASTLVYRIPRINLAIISYLALVAFWGITLIWEPDVWQNYQTMLKIAVLALTAHIVFRKQNQILLLFTAYCCTGVITLALNWNELHSLSAISGSEVLSEKDRFAGTFANANTAGMYAVAVLLFAVIVFFNSGTRWRWAILGIGLVAGLSICYFSGSRKGMLGLGLVALAIPWMAAVNPRTGRLNWIKGGVIAAAALATAALALSNLPFIDRLLVTLREGIGSEYSGQQRMDMLVQAFNLWTENPFFGCGFDGFARESGFGVYSHTTIGEVLCNAGITGIFLIGIYYLVPPVQMLSILRRTIGTPGSRLLMGLLVFWGLFALFSTFAVMLDSREYVAIYAAICGYAQENRLLGYEKFQSIDSMDGEVEQSWKTDSSNVQIV